MAAAHEAQMPFIRNLASSDRKLRTGSLDSLKLFLSSRTSLDTQDAVKLWKGLYYALWMTDRPAPQQRLAADLARLVYSLPRDEAKTAWFVGFWQVLSERWPHTEALRMDKFLLLVRRAFAVMLECAQKSPAVVDDVLREWPFEGTGDLRKVPLGLRLHVLDLWVDELESTKCLANEEAKDLVKKIGDLVLELQTCPVKAVRERAKENYQDGRLPWGTKDEDMSDAEEADDDDDDEWGGIEE
ncbi:unnamed protein product [Clonostachys chloroleuca]|uniref:Ribosomal RNA-processing protein 1 n=1 Tax=Clonostachys chloroleuca TaxID=1926264 RepID=A0AA35LZV1_9HYPO|nr:unnamed protein product [Clonostachys chloroleuca]